MSNHQLPTLQEAIRKYEAKKQEYDAAVAELQLLEKETKYHCTPAQRKHRHYLELYIRRNLKNELFSAECTIAEVQWYGEGAAV